MARLAEINWARDATQYSARSEQHQHKVRAARQQQQVAAQLAALEAATSGLEEEWRAEAARPGPGIYNRFGDSAWRGMQVRLVSILCVRCREQLAACPLCTQYLTVVAS